MQVNPIAESLLKAGAPVLAQVLGSVLPFPFNLVTKAALTAVSEALGVPPTPDAISGAIEANPDAASLKLQAAESQAAADMEMLKGQVALNAEEAKSPSMFIAGWRPAFAWIIIFWMNYSFLASISQGYIPPLPPELFNPAWVLFGGMMGLRTIEKWGGVAASSMKVIAGAKGAIDRLRGRK